MKHIFYVPHNSSLSLTVFEMRVYFRICFADIFINLVRFIIFHIFQIFGIGYLDDGESKRKPQY